MDAEASDRPFQQATQLFSARRYAEAAGCAEAWLARDPDDGRLWQILGASLWMMKDYLVALPALETATLLRPLYPLAQRALGDCYARLGKHDLAVTVYQHLVESGVCPTPLLPGLAAALNDLGQYELALRACRSLTARVPDHHPAHFATAYYLARLGAEPRELVASLSIALDLAPENLAYRINLSFVWATLKDFPRAYELLRSVCVDRADLPPCWLQRMQAIFDWVGDIQRSLECLAHLRKTR